MNFIASIEKSRTSQATWYLKLEICHADVLQYLVRSVDLHSQLGIYT